MASVDPATTSGPSVAAADRPAVTARMIADLRRALGELRCVGSERLVRRGISMSHLHIMSMLERHGELPMSRLAEVLDISVSGATGLIDRMEERGLVVRVRVPGDRRVVLVRVTDAGREALAELELFRDEVVTRILGQLDDPELTRLVAAVEDLRRAVASVMAEAPELLSHDHQLHGPVAEGSRGDPITSR